MFHKLLPRIDLRYLITCLVIASIIITALNILLAAFHVQREVMFNNTQESNRVAAVKLANTTELFLQNAFAQLSWSAKILGNDFNNDALLESEVRRLHGQTSSFNSVLVLNNYRLVRTIAPENLNAKGRVAANDALDKALHLDAPAVSPPFVTANHNYVVLITAPIKNKNGERLGLVGGSIYLEKNSILNLLLGQQYYRDGTRLRVMDANGNVLYDNDKKGGKLEPWSSGLFGHETSGSALLGSSTQEQTLAGFALIPSSGWTVLVDKPVSTTLHPLTILQQRVIWNAAPWGILTTILALIISLFLARPLWQLAVQARQMNSPKTIENISIIRSWYFESREIKRALLVGLTLLNKNMNELRQETLTDPMTGLLNRRGLQFKLEQWQVIKQDFTALAIDIDHFKQVNDTWGHETGDETIKKVAQLLTRYCREEDMVFRLGGEEFLVLMPNAAPAQGHDIAERLRAGIEANSLIAGHTVTISVGVAFSQDNATPDDVLNYADQALYRAKAGGRNRVIVYSRLPAI